MTGNERLCRLTNVQDVCELSYDEKRKIRKCIHK